MGVEEPFIRSTATVDLANIPEEDREENAPQSDLWTELEGFLNNLNGRMSK